jgi:hypothetical protein
MSTSPYTQDEGRSLKALQALANDLDKQIKSLPAWVQSLINRRVLTAQMIEEQQQIRAIATDASLPSLLQRQAG